jgi:hypothetical protein
MMGRGPSFLEEKSRLSRSIRERGMALQKG